MSADFEDSDFVAKLTVKRFVMEAGVGGTTPASGISAELRKAGLVPLDGASKAWQTKARDAFQQSHIVCTVSFPRRLLGLDPEGAHAGTAAGSSGNKYVRMTFVKLAASSPSCRMFPEVKGVLRPSCSMCAKYDKVETFKRQHGNARMPWGPPAKHTPALELNRETGHFAALHAHRTRTCSGAIQVLCRAIGFDDTAVSAANTRFLALLGCHVNLTSRVTVVCCVDRWAGSFAETISTLRVAADIRKRVLAVEEAHRRLHQSLLSELDSPSSLRVPGTPDNLDDDGTPGDDSDDVANVSIDLSGEFDGGTMEARIVALEKENRALKRALALREGGTVLGSGGQRGGEGSVLQTMSENQLLRKADRVRDLACERASFKRWQGWKDLARSRRAQALRVWRSGARLVALKTWQRSTAESKRQRALVARHVALMTNRIVSKAFRKWVEFANAADAAWAVGAKVVLRMKHRLSRMTLDALMHNARRNRARRVRLQGILGVMMNKVQWRAFGDWSRYVRDKPRRLKAMYEAVLDGNERVMRRKLLRQAFTVLRNDPSGSGYGGQLNRTHEILTASLYSRLWEKMKRHVFSAWHVEARTARAERITLRRLENRALKNKFIMMRQGLKAWQLGLTLMREETRATTAEEVAKLADENAVHKAETRVREEMLDQVEEAQYGTDRLREEAWRTRRILDYLESMINDSVRDSYLTSAVQAASMSSSGEILHGHLDKGLRSRALSLADRDFGEFKELLARIACRTSTKSSTRTSIDTRSPGQDVGTHTEVRSMVRTLKKMLGANAQGGSSVKLNEAAERARRSPIVLRAAPIDEDDHPHDAASAGGRAKNVRLVDGGSYVRHRPEGSYAALARSEKARYAKQVARKANASRGSASTKESAKKDTPRSPLKKILDIASATAADSRAAVEESEEGESHAEIFEEVNEDVDLSEDIAPALTTGMSSVPEVAGEDAPPQTPLARTSSLTLAQLKECAGIIQNWYTPLMDVEKSFGEVVVPPPGALRKFFNKIDYDNEGRLTHSELLTLLGQNLGGGSHAVPQRSIEQLVDALDMDGNGFVDMEEFLTLVHSVFITQGPGDTLAAVSTSFGFSDGTTVQALNNLEHIDVDQVLEKGTVLRLGDIPKEQYEAMDTRAVKALIACRGIPVTDGALPASVEDPGWLPAAIRVLQSHSTLHPMSATDSD